MLLSFAEDHDGEDIFPPSTADKCAEFVEDVLVGGCESSRSVTG